jgi:hypothetical protein
MKNLAIFSNSENLNYYQLERIQIQFTDWYYIKQGGLIMSKISQQSYIDLQKGLIHILSPSEK